jgi:hypothetical protein
VDRDGQAIPGRNVLMEGDGGRTRESRGHGGAPGFSWWVAAAVAVAAATAGVVVALILVRLVIQVTVGLS